MKILVYSTHPFEKQLLKAAADTRHHLSFTNELLNETSVQSADGFDAISVFTSDLVNESVLSTLSEKGVRWIALRSVGYDHVDLEAAARFRIKIANVPAYSPYAIAEHSVALLLALNRKLILSQRLMCIQDFRLDDLVGFDLHGVIVGVIGMGRIGKAFAKIMNGFGCQVIAYDPQSPSSDERGVERVSLEYLLSHSRVISLHCPYQEQTKHMIGEKAFQLMKKQTILINTARGGLVDTEALIKNIENGKLGGVGLDVYENEKGLFFYDHRHEVLQDALYSRLLSFPNVIVTGHQAFLTQEALQGIATTTIQNLTDWEVEGHSIHEVSQ